ncbi:MAG: aromatic amino acid lyase [Bacteroidetes bacterium]|uniref:Aromatic amino acid lyase n=1 Tax=Candidatus Gallipaludibacter merdavium TaxID=2840839 RepID=A0A9D9HT41_9BACT|nr:aromatic amino acid lyase [Candidatus Gallipaludibacter merdavium]
MVIKGTLNLHEVQSIIEDGCKIEIDEKVRKRVEESFSFLTSFAKDKVIYGINTGFGPMAQWRIDDKNLKELQYNIIRSHSVGVGEPLSVRCVRAAMLSRLMTFLQAHSGVNIQTCDLLVDFLNCGIYPVIPQHGSVGASGDLVQLAHIALALIGEGEVFYKGSRRNTEDVLSELNIVPLQMYTREGLAVTNGTAVMTGIGLVNLLNAKRLLTWSLKASVLMNEIASSYDDLMSEVLNGVKCHPGQQIVAAKMREIAKGSKMLLDREKELYHKNDEDIFKHKVQPYYSLRCIPQILGPVLDALINAKRVLIDELNSADDNPIVDSQNKMVIHGGNFHGDYVSFEMDKLKIAVTKMTMLAERQMNYLFHDRINGILPPFVNLGVLGLNYGMQAMQFTATSTTAECQTLSNSMYVHSIPNNNDNQDIVSMGTNSALICQHVIDNSFQVLGIHMIALVQAVDCLKIADKLAVETRDLYEKIRDIVPVFVEDLPKYKEIDAVIRFLKNN